MAGRLIVVSNRLPISITENKEGELEYQPSPGGMAAALNPVLRDESTVWVGWNGLNRALRTDERDRLSIPKQLYPINLEYQQYRAYYYNFANGSLWPTLHGFVPQRIYSQEDWDASLAVAERFAQEVKAIVGPDDLVWVHDFHLIMLPKLLRDAGCKNRIGFFLHIPFADPSLFSALPHSREMLESLQSADLCGFQTPGDVARFAACFSSVVGPDAAVPESRAFAVGIDYDRYHDAGASDEVHRYIHTFREHSEGRTVIFSASRLDYTKGILEQLDGIRRVITDAAERERYVYKLVVAPSREALSEYRDLKLAIDAAVEDINRQFSTADWKPIDYEYRNVPFEEMIALYCLADVMMVVPLIDGMNLIAKEYIAAKQDDDGALVLSSKAGAALQLSEAIVVDPTDPAAIAQALRYAENMPSDERRRRHAAMRRVVRTEDAFWWADGFTDALRSRPQR